MGIFEKALSFIKGKKGVEEKKIQLYADCIIFDVFGNLLLMERAGSDDFEPAKWCLPGGKIEEGEESSLQLTGNYKKKRQ